MTNYTGGIQAVHRWYTVVHSENSSFRQKRDTVGHSAEKQNV